MADCVTYFADFVGKEVNKALINNEHDKMYWRVDGKWFVITAVGECCSHSWFEHCDNANAFDGAQLFEFEDVSLDTIKTDYEVIRVNMLKFKTSKGYCTIEFRNESNGYYSGWAEIDEVSEENVPTVGYDVLTDF